MQEVYWLTVTAVAIFTIGIIMIFSTTSAESLDHEMDHLKYAAFLRQIAYGVAGLLLAAALWKIGFRAFLSMSPFFLAVLTFLLVLTLIPGIGREVNGSRRWLSLFGYSFQPSEFVKYVVPAWWIYRFLGFGERSISWKEFLKMALCGAIPILLIMVEPNNGTAVVIITTILVLCALLAIPWRYWALPLLLFTVIVTTFAWHLPYVSARVHVYLHPELDLKGRGHQPYQAKIAAGSGGLFGKGIGNGWQKLSYLPEAQNDYIAAIYAEELGFFGMTLLITLYMTLCLLGLRIALTTAEPSAFYLAAIVTFVISFQAFLNLGVVSGLLPSTGLNLPLFSQGGTSLMANIMGLTLLANIAKEGEKISA